MKISVTVKILLALFLGAFVWFVVISIQTPRGKTTPSTAPALRLELISRSEDVNLEIGEISVSATVQEVYRNGEIHFRDFTMRQETEERTVTVTGKLAQTEIQGSEVTFMEMEGDIHLVSSDGLDLRARTLNYIGTQNRIFTQTPAEFTLKNITGRADRLAYNTETRLLELWGDVRTTYYPLQETPVESPDGAEALDETPEGDSEPEGEGEEAAATEAGAGEEPGPSFETEPTDILCERLIFDQENNRLMLEERVRLSQTGSFLRAGRIEADLTDGNRRFERMVASAARSRVRDGGAPERDTAEEGEHPSLSQRASGVKTLRAEKLTLIFFTRESNSLERIVAEGEALLELEPTREQRAAGNSERKRLFADRIEAKFGEGGEGLKTLYAVSREGMARIEIEPLSGRRAGSRGERQGHEPKTISAREISAEIDPETGDFSTVTMSGGLEMWQGATVVTGTTGLYDQGKDQLQVDGEPLLRDDVKLVKAEHMLASLAIGDLSADGDVRSTFFPSEDDDEGGVFAIGEEAVETYIAADSLRLDYKNKVLRYSKDVETIQGDNIIESRKLDIFQAEKRLIATGKVKATLLLPAEQAEGGGAESAEDGGAESAEDGEPRNPGAGGTAEPERGQQDGGGSDPAGSPGRGRKSRRSGNADMVTLRIQAEMLDFDKKHGVLRLAKNVTLRQEGMTISCEQLRYELGDENRLKRAFAQEEVQVTIGSKVISGDKAEYFVAEKVLVVQGKNVRLWEENKLEANHHKLTFDIANDTLRFDARADQLLRTRITTH